MSDSLQSHGLQHARVPGPSLSLRVCSNSCPLSQWCHPTISSSISCFSWPQPFPASGTFPVCRLFISGGQSIGASVSTPVLPIDIQGCFSLGLTGLIFLMFKAKQLTWREHSAPLTLQEETVGLKIYWAWSCPLEQDHFLHIWILFIYRIELILFGSLLFHVSITNIFLGY